MAEGVCLAACQAEGRWFKSHRPLKIYSSRKNGAVPKWLRERSAKPRFVGSNPTRASMTHLATLKIQK